jgi:hypothetical protein
MDRGRSLLLHLFLAGAGTIGAAAQQRQEPVPVPPQFTGPEVTPPVDPREEIIRLFHEVEQKLQAIDLELAEASAGEAPLKGVEDGGIEELLRGSNAMSGQVVQGIDKILDLASQLQGSKGGT